MSCVKSQRNQRVYCLPKNHLTFNAIDVLERSRDLSNLHISTAIRCGKGGINHTGILHKRNLQLFFGIKQLLARQLL